MRYIVDISSSNPKLLERNDNGTYTALAQGYGDSSIPQIMELVYLANTAAENNL